MSQSAWLKALFTLLPSHRAGQAFAQSAAGEAVTAAELGNFLPDHYVQSHPDHAWTIDDLRHAERNRHQSHRRRSPKRRKS